MGDDLIFKGIEATVVDENFKFDVELEDEDGFLNVHDIKLARLNDDIVGVGVTQVERELKFMVFTAISDDTTGEVGSESFYNYTDVEDMQSFPYTEEGLVEAQEFYADELARLSAVHIMLYGQ